MRFYGYVEGSEDNSPAQLEEVTLSADPVTLRRMAEFLSHVAETIEKHGERFGHEHFEDFVGNREPRCRFVVVSERMPESVRSSSDKSPS